MNATLANPRARLLYDGLCPICSREARLLKKKDHHDQIELVDIAARDFDPTKYGVTLEETHRKLHLIRTDGSIVTAMDAVREMYRTIGKGWVMAWTGWPVLRPIFDLIYRIFARYRRKIALRRTPCNSDACSL